MLTFILNALVAVLVITDPLGNTPIFASLLKQYSPPERNAIIRRACIAAVAILILFTLTGGVIFKIFGINIMTRLLGLILAVMAIQFVINGIRDLFPEIFG